MPKMFKLQKKIKTVWSSNFAYAIGLITSDGYLHGDGRHIGFVSKEAEMMRNFKKALNLTNKVGHGINGQKTSHYLYIKFGDKNFYLFLNKLGISKAKSKTIKSVNIPARYFSDFVRGLYDGDGSFYTFWDKRWPNSFGYKVTFASASFDFLSWLQTKLSAKYGVKGHIRKGKGVYEIRYVKGDSEKLFKAMYYKPGLLFLKRKHDKISSSLRFNKKIKLSKLPD